MPAVEGVVLREVLQEVPREVEVVWVFQAVLLQIEWAGEAVVHWEWAVLRVWAVWTL